MYRLMVNDLNGQPLPNSIEYMDPEGVVWNVPRGHRYWDAYEEWLAEGNEPLPAGAPWTTGEA